MVPAMGRALGRGAFPLPLLPQVLLATLLLAEAATHDERRLEPDRPDHTQHLPYFAQTLSVVEAENFSVASPPGSGGSAVGWQPLAWGHSSNYFASVVANVFHSRRAYLHAPANASTTAIAVATLNISQPGNYTPLVRFEAPFGYDVPFALELLDGTGRVLLTHMFGLRESLKVWGFGKARAAGHTDYDTRPGVAPSYCAPGLAAECKWPWSAFKSHSPDF